MEDGRGKRCCNPSTDCSIGDEPILEAIYYCQEYCEPLKQTCNECATVGTKNRVLILEKKYTKCFVMDERNV